MEQHIRVIDSHTAGEPTRVVVDGGPDLGVGSIAERRLRFAINSIGSAPPLSTSRGSDVLVGAILTAPVNPDCCAGVIYFNNAGVLHMCGHGTIGVVVTLARMGRIGMGINRLETPVGVVGFEYHGHGRVTIENVPSFRLQTITIETPELGRVDGDIAWGGNWFFLTGGHKLELSVDNLERLNQYSGRIKSELHRRAITGLEGAEIDHIELTGPPVDPRNHGRNFVLCPGGAYDRSPCGTGTSAKLACLYADGKLREGDVWRQESVIGSVFEGSIRVAGDKTYPRITGSAFVTAEATLILDPDDPFRTGFKA